MIKKENNMEDIVKFLNYHTRLYDEGHPIISDKEWDKAYFELLELEKKTNTVLPDSPTNKISYTIVNNLTKVKHNHLMLSLDKTKSLNEVANFVGKKSFIAMSKMDGLTCSLRYLNGKLISAETRGNGEEGEDIYHNALVIKSIPKHISYKEELIVDGEIICLKNDFKPFTEEYANPRNFAAGSIRLLDSEQCSKRNLTFVAWTIIKGLEEYNELDTKLEVLDKFGFRVVPYLKDPQNLQEAVDWLKIYSDTMQYPIDGLVFKFNNIAYGQSLGNTSHHFKDAIAFKFYDEVYNTELIDIDWSLGRTGIITPVAVFKPVDDGESIIERASLHNLTVMNELLGTPYKNQNIRIFKSNMIIPQVLSADVAPDVKNEKIELPKVCPVCGQEVEIKGDNNSNFLYCPNPDCEGKLINQLVHFCGKKGLDIKGLSKATLEKLIDWNWVTEPADIFELSKYRIVWADKAGFGKKSVDNILAAIETAKQVPLATFLSALGIPLIGIAVAKDLVKYFSSYEEFRQKVKEGFDFSQLDGFAESKTNSILHFDYSKADKVYKYLNCIIPIEELKDKTLEGKTVVITGRLEHFKNRAELENEIAARGGKVIGSVSKNTTYLVNNDATSQSSKNLSAQKLNIPILTEQEFISKFLTK